VSGKTAKEKVGNAHHEGMGRHVWVGVGGGWGKSCLVEWFSGGGGGAVPVLKWKMLQAVGSETKLATAVCRRCQKARSVASSQRRFSAPAVVCGSRACMRGGRETAVSGVLQLNRPPVHNPPARDP